MNITRNTVFSIRDMALIGMFAAILSVISQIAIPMPAGVPMTIQVFGVGLIGTVLGTKRGFLTLIVYILIGAVGAPVFAGLQGGLQVLVSTAGGYILTWPFMAALCGIRTGLKDPRKNLIATLFLALIGLAMVEGFGALQWAYLTQGNLGPILLYSLVAFIPKDIVLTLLAVLFGRTLRRQMERVLD